MKMMYHELNFMLISKMRLTISKNKYYKHYSLKPTQNSFLQNVKIIQYLQIIFKSVCKDDAITFKLTQDQYNY